MMVLVRRMKSYDPDGTFIGVFSAFDRMTLYIAIDEFCDPYYCEFYIVPNGLGFLLNDVTSKEYENLYDQFRHGIDDQDEPEVKIDDISGDLFNEKMFTDDSLWQPLIPVEEEDDFIDWYSCRKKPTEEDLFNLLI